MPNFRLSDVDMFETERQVSMCTEGRTDIYNMYMNMVQIVTQTIYIFLVLQSLQCIQRGQIRIKKCRYF